MSQKNLLSSEAIALLARVSDEWEPEARYADPDGPLGRPPRVTWRAEWRELAAQGLVLGRVGPPPIPSTHNASAAARAHTSHEFERVTQVRRTIQGRDRLARIRGGRR